MADYGLFIGYGTAMGGRERQALRVYSELIGHLNGLAAMGELESVEMVQLQPHGGDLGGFVLVRGGAEQIGKLQGSEEFQRIVNRALIVVQNLGIVNASLGAGVQAIFADYESHLADLT